MKNQYNFKAYWSSLLIIVVFGLISITQLVTVYLPLYTKIASSTDFVCYQTATIARKENSNPYDRESYLKVAIDNKYIRLEKSLTRKIVATYLYPPFGIQFFRSWLTDDIQRSARIFSVIQVISTIFSLLIFIKICQKLGINPNLTTLGLAFLSLFYLHSNIAQDSLRLGQINPIVGMIVLMALLFALSGQKFISYVSIALAGSLKIIPTLLVLSLKIKPRALFWGGLVPVVLMNVLDFQLFTWYITTPVLPDKTWMEHAYSMTINLGLPAQSYRLLGSSIFGQFLGYVILLVSILLSVKWQMKATYTPSSPSTPSNPNPSLDLKSQEVILSALLFLALSLATSIFWNHHIEMAIGVYILAELCILQRKGRMTPTYIDLLAIISLCFLLFSPKFSYSGRLAFLNFIFNIGDTLVILFLWIRYVLLLIKENTLLFRFPSRLS